MKDFKIHECLLLSAQEKVDQIAAVADMLPESVIIHRISDWSVIWMSQRGLDYFGVSLEEMTSLTAEQYHLRYFNPVDAEDYVPKIAGLMEENDDDKFVTFFQQVRTSTTGTWSWFMSSIKILARDDDGNPLLTINSAIPIDAMHHMSIKAERLLEENNFLRRNFHLYTKLGKRERDVLKLMALGKSSSESAESLFISQHTVETHRKNIRQKLGTSSYYELCEYARAFDLV